MVCLEIESVNVYYEPQDNLPFIGVLGAVNKKMAGGFNFASAMGAALRETGKISFIYVLKFGRVV